MNIDKLYDTFKSNAIAASLAFLKGDSKANKVATKKMEAAFKKIEANLENMRNFYEQMMKEENVYVRLKAITYCGNTKFDVDWALQEIKKILNNKDLSDLDKLTINYAIKRWETEK